MKSKSKTERKKTHKKTHKIKIKKMEKNAR